MSELLNPFAVFGYAGAAYFCDRENETKELISALRNGRNVTLRSPRRVGKTGLIQHVFAQLAQTNPEIKCFYVDLFSTHSLDEMVVELGKAIIGQLDTPLQKIEGYMTQFFKSCRLYLSPDPLTGAPKLNLDLITNNPAVTLDEIFAYIRKSERECYIAVDEFQQIVEYPQKNVEALLRTYMQQCPNVRFIFSGSKQHLMSDIFNSPKRPFYRSTDKMTLEAIPESVYYAFAERWLQKAGTHMPEEIFHDIYTRASGYTWYIQYMLNRLYEMRPKVVEEADVMACLNYIVQREEEDYRKMYSMLTNNQTQVLRAIAKEQIVAAPTAAAFLKKYNLPAISSVKRVIDFLKEKEYIYPANEGYIIYDRFMAIWLQRL
jgi:AAA+ ATPase superfamily predicted ATPase